MRLAGARVIFWSKTVRWKATAPGIEVCLFKEKTVSGETRVAAVRLDPAHCDFRVIYAKRNGLPGNWVESVCPSTGVAINGSYFADDRTPIGLLVVDGQVLQRHFPVHEWGAFRIRHGKPEIVKSTDDLPNGVTQALECKPRLIINGSVPHFKPNPPAARSAVGMDAEGRVILAAVERGYLTQEQWAACLKDRFHCVNALNLDGGPSTQLAVRGQINIAVKGGSPVPVFLTAVPRQ